MKRWDYDLNKCDPKTVNYKTSKKYFFMCEKLFTHKSKAITIFHIADKKCSVKCEECNSLIFKYPESLLLWSEKNTESIHKYSYGSNQNAWWKCENGKHEDYKKNINTTVNTFNFRCPSCIQERNESLLQESVRLFLEELCKKYGWKLNHEQYCLIKLRNPKTNYPLHYDNEIIAENFKIIIEVHGKQHYEFIKLFHRIKSKFRENQKLDKIKKKHAIKSNYTYIEISYSDINWKNNIEKVLSEKGVK